MLNYNLCFKKEIDKYFIEQLEKRYKELIFEAGSINNTGILENDSICIQIGETKIIVAESKKDDKEHFYYYICKKEYEKILDELALAEKILIDEKIKLEAEKDYINSLFIDFEDKLKSLEEYVDSLEI